jgi:hypothetical protein
MKLVFVTGLLLAATLLSFGQTEKAAQDQKTAPKKVQRIKMVMKQNGKEIKIDTTFNFADEKMVKAKVDSIMKKLEKEGIQLGDSNGMIRHMGKQMYWSHFNSKSSPHAEEIEVYVNDGDTGKVKHERKVIRLNYGAKGQGFGPDGDGMVPPPPPVPHVRAFRFAGGDPFAMDPDNKDIVSYDRKDIGKGLEKITIVRKKHDPEAKKEVKVQVHVQDEPKK